ncbi:hypothetical protein DL93DRAFT_2090898 [Clavulina sp. PMI_390]|nr:hypothetical protein DL93DRAFT_2090898 [Clavulina sp. PMI_390]
MSLLACFDVSLHESTARLPLFDFSIERLVLVITLDNYYSTFKSTSPLDMNALRTATVTPRLCTQEIISLSFSLVGDDPSLFT